MDAFYRIEIAAKTDRGISSDTLDCLLGLSLNQTSCGRHSVIRADWTLTSGDVVVARGSSYDRYCCGGTFSRGVAARQIGSFQSEKGRRYVLEIQILEDGSALVTADPHLNIEEGGNISETGSVVDGLLLWPCGTALIFGVYLLVSAAIRSRKLNDIQIQQKMM